MSDTVETQDRQRELEALNRSIRNATIKWWIWQVSHVACALVVALFGFLTTSAGVSPPPWYSTPNALFYYGAIGVLIGAFQATLNPGATKERQHLIKFALHAIQMTLEGRRISVTKANQLRVMALTKPEDVLSELNSLPVPST